MSRARVRALPSADADWLRDRVEHLLLRHCRLAEAGLYIDQDPEGRRFFEELQHGGRSIPTIVFPDGSHLIEPFGQRVKEPIGATSRLR